MSVGGKQEIVYIRSIKPYHRFLERSWFSKNVASIKPLTTVDDDSYRNVCVWMITDWSQTQQAAGVFIRNTDSAQYTN